MGKERLIAFTDAVLAIIMTILVLELKKPSEMTLDAFWALRASFFSYLLSFFWIGSSWITMNRLWEHVKRINRRVAWWNLLFLLALSFMPYATGIVSSNFNNALAQAVYGIVVIATSICSLISYKVLDAPNSDSSILLEETKKYRKILLIDIIIKCIALVLAVTVYPQCMMYGVLTAAVYLQIAKLVIQRPKKNAQQV